MTDGEGCGISEEQLNILRGGIGSGVDVGVVVVRKDSRMSHAEGRLVKLGPTGKKGSYRWRYDEHIEAPGVPGQSKNWGKFTLTYPARIIATRIGTTQTTNSKTSSEPQSSLTIPSSSSLLSNVRRWATPGEGIRGGCLGGTGFGGAATISSSSSCTPTTAGPRNSTKSGWLHRSTEMTAPLT